MLASHSGSEIISLVVILLFPGSITPTKPLPTVRLGTLVTFFFLPVLLSSCLFFPSSPISYSRRGRLAPFKVVKLGFRFSPIPFSEKESTKIRFHEEIPKQLETFFHALFLEERPTPGRFYTGSDSSWVCLYSRAETFKMRSTFYTTAFASRENKPPVTYEWAD